MAESFFAALKNECVYRTQYPTREQARRDVVRYIEFWYNSRRGTPDFSTGARSRSTTNTWNGCPQRELTTNPLSGKLGADQLRFQALRRFHGLHPDFVGSAILAPALAGSTWTSTAGDESLRTARFATTS